MNPPEIDPAKIQAAFARATEAFKSFSSAAEDARNVFGRYVDAQNGVSWGKLRSGKRRIVRRKSTD